MSKTFNYYTGIDVGLSGAMCVLDKSGALANIVKMPIVKVVKSAYKRWYDINALKKFFTTYPFNYCTLEYQRPMPQQGISSTFRLGRGFGLLEGLTNAFCKETVIIDPKVWQNYFKKKYFTSGQIEALKEKNYQAEILTMDIIYPPIKERYLEYINLKSTDASKATMMLILDRLLNDSSDHDHVNFKNHNIVDAYLIAKYCFYNATKA